MGRDIYVKTVFALRINLEGLIDSLPYCDNMEKINDAIAKFTGENIDPPEYDFYRNRYVFDLEYPAKNGVKYLIMKENDRYVDRQFRPSLFFVFKETEEYDILHDNQCAAYYRELSLTSDDFDRAKNLDLSIFFECLPLKQENISYGVYEIVRNSY